MECKICGTEKGVIFNPALRYSVCPDCAAGTPAKASFTEFCERYFKDDPACPSGIKKEFYDDYLCSKDTLDEYIADTTRSEDEEFSRFDDIPYLADGLYR
jgi:hypothetical protein